MDGKLAKIYYDPSHPAAFGGISKLAKATGEPYDEVERWLQTQRAYTLHRPVRKHFKTTPYLVRGIDGQWQADLVDVSEMSKHDSYLLSKEEMGRLEKVIFAETRGPRRKAKMNPKFIGKDAAIILREIGLNVPDSVKLAVADVHEDHPLLWTEQLMPVLPVTRVPNADYAIDLAIAMEAGYRHTAVMWSKNIDNLSRMAKECDCSIFVKNGTSHAGLGLGGEGYCSFTISSPTGEGLTGPRSFSRWRRCTLVDSFRIT